jgi:hypothetical protein
VILLHGPSDDGIEAGDRGTIAKRRTNQTAQPGARAARSRAGAPSTRTHLGTNGALRAAGSIDHGIDIDAQGRTTGFGPQDVRVGDVEVVARNTDIQVIFEGERNRVIHGQIDLSILHQLIDARGIGKIRGRDVLRGVRSDEIGKMRARFRVVLQHKLLRLRRLGRCCLGGGRGGLGILGPTAHGQHTDHCNGRSLPGSNFQTRQRHFDHLHTEKLRVKDNKAELLIHRCYAKQGLQVSSFMDHRGGNCFRSYLSSGMQ